MAINNRYEAMYGW